MLLGSIMGWMASSSKTEPCNCVSELPKVSRKAISSRSSTQGQCGRKTQCLHPDKPMMFACADCPRRNSKAASEDLDAQPMAVAALVGEEVASNACCRKTQCLHPDKPMMFACADCPRRNSKAAGEDLDAQPMAVAALVGEEVTSNACCRKTQCLHPDKPMMFACADCPRRNSKAASEDLDAQPMAVAALVGEEVTSNACCRKTQCLHPDKPMMFACADCPRRNSKAASEDLDAQPMAVAALVGEEVTSNACCRKTQCLHPDKPMMFACADCPRRNSKAASEDLDAQPMAVAALVGEEVTSNACCRKTQCLHPDKPMMFACADCPRRNSKAASEDLDAQPMAVAALVGEEVASNACCRKTQCLHPDKPMMFACADCPRRNSKAAGEDLDAQPMAVAALVGEEVTSNACCRKTQCLHPDKPMMFACADCPRRNSKAASEDLDAQPMAVAALVGEEVTSNACCRKTQCLHPDKPMMFACADCPRRNSKAASEDLDAQPMAVAALVGEEVASSACCRKTQCLHPDKPMMFACADCPRRNSKAASEDLDAQPMAVAALVGEEVTSNACCRKTQCLHPDKPMMFACADCPRRNSKAASEDLDAQPMAVAALVGEEVTSNLCG